MARSILGFAAIAEVGTGIALMVVPALVAGLLLGLDVSGAGILVGRVAGVALLALGVACWPGRQAGESGSPAARAMLLYSALIALYLAYLAAIEHVAGPLLWPAVAVHAVVALLLARATVGERKASR